MTLTLIFVAAISTVALTETYFASASERKRRFSGEMTCAHGRTVMGGYYPAGGINIGPAMRRFVR